MTRDQTILSLCEVIAEVSHEELLKFDAEGLALIRDELDDLRGRIGTSVRRLTAVLQELDTP